MSPIDPELDVADVTVRGRATAADRNDLAALEEIHGELPIEPIAGVDDQ